MMRAAPIVAVVLLAAASCAPIPETPPPPRLDVADVLGGNEAAGYARALLPRSFDFPADHGAHPDFAAEWWYFTGNLDADDGRRFGYQLTLFRTALQPPAARRDRASAWASEQVWMGHFALTDVDNEAFHAFDRFQRGALGLAGARAAPWRVWLDDWSIEQVGERPFPLRLRAAARPSGSGDLGELVAIDLRVEPDKPVVLQGDDGLSRKGSEAGNASYYYSFTRMDTAGSVRLGDDEIGVRGASWLDREWSTSVLESGQAGWDWFALQLDDGSDLMYYQIRNRDGSAAATSAGTLVGPAGGDVSLSGQQVDLQVQDTWRSPIDGAEYPAAWTLSIPSHGVDLTITPVLADQELDVAFRYWEGAVDVRGTGTDGRPVSGRGYVELTGYAEGARSPDPATQRPPDGSSR